MLLSFMKTILIFQVIKKLNVIIVTSWLIEYCHIGNFGFQIQILKYLNIKNYSANFNEDCKINFKEVLVKKINGIINSGKFSRSYDDF